MKNKFLLTSILALLMGLSSFAQIITVSGTLTDVNQNPVPNQSIDWWFSPNAPIMGTTTGNFITDAQGSYNDTLAIAATFSQGWVLLGTVNCDGTMLYDTLMVSPATPVLTSQMIYCDTANSGTSTNCSAQFTHAVDTFGTIQFISTATGVAPYSYLWQMGDGSSSTSSNPLHYYNSFGTFSVCLKITDATGCTSTFCDSVVISSSANCSANFTYQSTGVANQISFTGNASGGISPYAFSWGFGDGNTATIGSPTHTYANSGTYIVVLTISDAAGCSATTTSTVITNSGGSTINGMVYTGDTLAAPSTVYLIEYDSTSGGILTAIDTTTIQQGFYSFSNVLPGDYLVKAALNVGPNGGTISYIPTYYMQGTPLFPFGSPFWSSADFVQPSAAGILFDIHMVPGVYTSGPGFIGGFVSQGANKTQGPGDGLENVLVLLLDNQDAPLAYTLTNSEGEFEFADLAYGSYKVYTEVTGISTQAVEVTIDAQNEIIDLVDIILNSNGVNGTVGISNNKLQMSKNSIRVYPNPSNNFITVGTSGFDNAKFSIQDVLGRTQLNGNVSSNQELNISNLENGLYFIAVTQNGKTIQSKFVKK